MNRRASLALIGLMAALMGVFLFGLDRPVARLAATADPSLLALFRFITWFGQGGVVLVPAGLTLIAAWWAKPRLPSLAAAIDRTIAGAAQIFVAVAVAGLANDALKYLFGRARPRLWLHGDIDGFYFLRFGSDYASFPSGHTATSVAAALAFAALVPRWRIAFGAFALLIALSRIVLDAHYLSDVIGGAAVGAASATVTLAWFRRRAAGNVRSLSLPDRAGSPPPVR